MKELTYEEDRISIKNMEDIADKIFDFKRKANIIHQNKYEYTISNDFKSISKITIICPIHGEFIQKINNHLSGKGCPKCGLLKRTSKLIGGCEKTFIEKANKKHNNFYNYNKINYKNPKTKICITCPIHGDFIQRPDSHLNGSGCKKCKSDKFKSQNTLSQTEFIDKAQRIHKDKYEYNNSIYLNTETPIDIICPIHGEFSQKPKNHLTGRGCKKCGSMQSKLENFIEDFLIKYNIKYTKNDRTIISPKELDFFIKNKNIAIECHGLYWHSEEKKKNKNFHLNKLNLCNQKNIKLIQIFEDEIVFKPKIVINRLKNVLGLIKYKIYARKCEVKEVSSDVCKKFLNKYHIQGSDKSSIKLGLYYNNRLVSIMTFAKSRISLGHKNNFWELVRFCSISNFTIVGGAGKLFNYFVKNYSNDNKIITFSDRRWSEGNFYEKIGFTYDHDSKPNYWYIKQNSVKRFHRFGFRKSKLITDGHPKNLTEKEITNSIGLYRIYDCGNKCYIFDNKI